MGINLGQTPTKAVYFGQTAVKSVFFGNNQVWGGEEPGPAADWLCFTAEQSNSTVRLDKVGSPDAISLETSTNGISWTDYGWTGGPGDTVTLDAGERVYFRAKTENQKFSTDGHNYYKFVMTGKIAASGSVQTLLKADGSRTDVPACCYNGMFNGCTSLADASGLELPATTLNESCYGEMFQNCSSLTAAPALPATALAHNCYSHLFQNCTSLSAAPALPATTLSTYCYAGMFEGDTSLTDAPKLPAQQLTSYCYHYMFNGCTSLSSVEVSFTAWKMAATNSWLQNVAASGVFICPDSLPDSRGSGKIPSGWTKAAPAEPLCFTAAQANSTVRLDKVGSPGAISLETSTDGTAWTDYSWTGTTGDTATLANIGDKVYMRAKAENQTIGSSSSNYYKFVMTGKIAASGSVQTLLKANGSRTDAPTYCYFNMFNGCASLAAAPELPATTLANNCYYYMFQNCSSLTAAPALPATTLASGCYSNMFKNCTSLSAAPALPATTLPSSCYASMFQNCSSLTAAPALPATTLAANCYSNMFYGCAPLSSVDVSFTAWDPANATGKWLSGVAATGVFYCPYALDTTTRNVSHVPVGWNVVNAGVEPTYVHFTNGQLCAFDCAGAFDNDYLAAQGAKDPEYPAEWTNGGRAEGLSAGRDVTSIGAEVFPMDELTACSFPDGLSAIGDLCFTNSACAFTLPSSVVEIGSDAFMHATGLAFEGRTLAQVESMANHPWGTDPSVISAELG